MLREKDRVRITAAETREANKEIKEELLQVTQTYRGLPPITGIDPPGYRTPESIKAREDRFKEEQAAYRVLEPSELRPTNKEQRETNQEARIEQELTKVEWKQVAQEYQKTGNARTIAHSLSIKTEQARHLIEKGIMRLGLPSIREYAIDQTKINTDIRERHQDRQKQALLSDDVARAIQERATEEASAAKILLDQTNIAGTIVGGYVKALLNSLQSGKSGVAIPENISLQSLVDLTKVLDTHTKAMERAVKLMNLTQGKPTERIEHQVGAMLAICTTQELEEANITGKLPSRLTSRLGAADPIDKNHRSVIEAQAVRIQSDEGDTDVSTEQDQPDWLDTIQPAEGVSEEAPDDQA